VNAELWAQNLHGQLTHTQVLPFASRPRILFPKRRVFEYLANMLCYYGYKFLGRNVFKALFVLAEGIAHDMLSQRLLSGLVIPGNAVSCINTEPSVMSVHEILDEIIGYLAFAFLLRYWLSQGQL
jgi:hypothetical protein